MRRDTFGCPMETSIASRGRSVTFGPRGEIKEKNLDRAPDSRALIKVGRRDLLWTARCASSVDADGENALPITHVG